MCGIAGIVDPNLSPDSKTDLVHKMLWKITHRGPEASNVYTSGPVSLGHNRLKIIDLSDEANQPFEYMDLSIVFNGEIYNYIEIKAVLEKKGFLFRTHGDTEVICAAYKLWGEDCVKQFMGMWSFALWDKTQQKLFCSRDRFGIKPFYFFQYGQGFAFGSEYKVFSEVPNFNKELNIEMMNRGLQMVWATFADETYYKYLKSLLPAHNLIWHNGKITIRRYWDIDFTRPRSNLSWEQKKEEFYNRFKESIQMHVRSDVQNGMCLSGGLDSSAIASMYSTQFPGSKIKSFSVYFEGEGAVDERPFVYEVVKKYPNIEPHYLSPSNQQISDHFHRAAYHSDVPLLASTYIAQHFLMQLAKSEDVTVVLDGQGSDEYLGGYMHSFYRVIANYLKGVNLPGALQLLNANRNMEGYSASKTADIFLKSMVSSVSNEERIYNLEYGRLNAFVNAPVQHLSLPDRIDDKFENFLYHLLFSTTLQTLLHYEDRNSMAFSIESRVPFLDHRLVEFAFTLNREDRINNRAETKYILREALRPILPRAVAERKDKKGFVTPGEVRWLNGPLKFLLGINYSDFHWLKQDKVKAIVEQYKKGDTSKAAFVWRIACMDYWLKNFY